MIDPSREQRLNSIVHDYLQAVDAGRRPDPAEIIGRHPEFADELRDFFADQHQMDRFAQSMNRARAGERTIGTGHTGDTAAEHVMPRIRYFGDYELLEEIARGGMGVVYKARQVSLNRIVALKMILAGQLASVADLQRFRAEAEAAANLDHPNIVPIHEIGEHEGNHYFSMKLIEGGNLSALIPVDGSPSRKAIAALSAVARAVHFAHQRGILHRDLKPANILLDANGVPMVTDFGLAKRTANTETSPGRKTGEAHITHSGAILGTPSYMAPEQARAEKALSTAVDVYSLGAILFELLTGQPPFRAGTPLDTLLQVLEKEPARPSKVRPGSDRDLETICLKCLEKEPGRRYPSAEALADDLDRWLSGQPILARPSSATERMVKWVRRQPLLAGSLGAIGAATIVLLTLSGFLWRNAELRAQAVQNLDVAREKLAHIDGELKDVDEKRKQADVRRHRAEADRDLAGKLADAQRKIADEQAALAKRQKLLADKIEAEVKRLEGEADSAKQQLQIIRNEALLTTYAADMQLAHAAWQTGNITGVNDLLQRYQKPVGADPRGFEWHYLHNRVHGARLEWNVRAQPSMFEPINSLALSADGSKLATWDGYNKDIMLWNARTGKLTKSIAIGVKPVGTDPPMIVGMRFTDDGRGLVAAIHNPDDDRERHKVVAAARRKDKLDLRLLQDHLQLRTWDLSEDRPGKTAPFELAKAPFAVLSQTAIPLFIQHDGEPMAVNCLASSRDSKFAAFGGWPLRISDRGKEVLLVADNGGRLIVWDIAKSRVHALQNAPSPLTAVAFSPDGNQLAIGNIDGVVGVGTPDAVKPPRLFVGHRGAVCTIRFSRDGSRLFSAAADGPIIEWAIDSGKQVVRRLGHTQAVLQLETAADGKTLVSGGADGSLKVWDLASITEPLVLRGHKGQILSLAFTSNGKDLLSVDRHGVLKTWSATDGKLVRDTSDVVVTPAAVHERINVVSEDQVKFAPNGSSIIWRTGDQMLDVRHLVTGKQTRLAWKDNIPFALAVSADDRWAASGNLLFAKTGGLVVWNLADGQHVTLREPGQTRGLVFATDNKRLFAAHSSGVIIWDWQANQVQRLEPKVVMNLVAVSRDDTMVAGATVGGVGGQATIRIWDMKSKRLKVEFRGAGGQIRHLAFSPDGRRLATVGDTSLYQSVLKLWDTSSGREVFAAAPPPGMITALALSPDGHRLAAATLPHDPTAPLAGRQTAGDIHIWDATPMK